VSSLRTLQLLFALAKAERDKKREGRFRGRHCAARLLRAQAKRRKAGKTVYHPAFRHGV
jgi:hypothetical protein